MQARLKADSIDAFDLLAEAGADCIGAIQLVGSLPVPSVKHVHAKAISDGKIAEILKKRDITIARRTVAKYREQLDIPVARLRKEIL